MPELFQRSDNVVLHYRDQGQGIPVLLIHGVGSDLQSWDGVISGLTLPCRCIRYDLRGHGNSSRTAEPFSLTDLVEDAVALMDHIDIEQVSVVGFSLGGLIAQALALAHPERVVTLSLISTIAGRTREEQDRVTKRVQTLAKHGASAHLANAVDRWFTDEFIAAHPEVLEARRQKSLQNDPQSYVSAYRVLAENDLADQLSAITVPTQVATGENDIGSSPRMAELIHQSIAGSRLHIFPRLKHSVLLEAPDQVAEILDQFLELNIDRQHQ